MPDLNEFLSKNFQLWEFVTSPTATAKGISNMPNNAEVESLRLLCKNILQPAREALGPLKVNSGFRSAALNNAVGGSKTSDHRKGFAADIVPVKTGTLELAQWVVQNCKKFDQVILEFGTPDAPDWIHLSANPRNRKQIMRATLSGKKTVYSDVDKKALLNATKPPTKPVDPEPQEDTPHVPTPHNPTPTAEVYPKTMQGGVKWLKQTFGPRIKNAIKGTPFSIDLVAAVALQETYYIWSEFFNDKTLTEEQKLKLCVGDTLDTPNRSAFPKNRAALEAHPDGKEMFKVARAALESLAPYSPIFKSVAANNKNKFCHGYGIFQYDIQHFKVDPMYFLNEDWKDFDKCLGKLVHELDAAMSRAFGGPKTKLSDDEMVFVAIAYNRGRYDPTRGFKQGFKDQSGKFYGEYMRDYLRLAKAVV